MHNRHSLLKLLKLAQHPQIRKKLKFLNLSNENNLRHAIKTCTGTSKFLKYQTGAIPNI